MDFAPDLVARALGGICEQQPGDFQWAHFGAAILATHFFLQDSGLDAAAQVAVVAQAERLAARQSNWLRDPTRSSPADPASVADQLAEGADRLSVIGHDLIFASIALRAMHERPELATNRAVHGLVRLVREINSSGMGGPFVGWDDPEEAHDTPDPTLPEIESHQELAAVTLERFAQTGPVHAGNDQGVVHHILTHALALIELDELGYHAASQRGRQAQRTYLTLLTRRPDPAGALPNIDLDCTDLRSADWWATDRCGELEWLLGHAFKVPWAFYRLAEIGGGDVTTRLEPVLAYTLTYT